MHLYLYLLVVPAGVACPCGCSSWLLLVCLDSVVRLTSSLGSRYSSTTPRSCGLLPKSTTPFSTRRAWRIFCAAQNTFWTQVSLFLFSSRRRGKRQMLSSTLSYCLSRCRQLLLVYSVMPQLILWMLNGSTKRPNARRQKNREELLLPVEISFYNVLLLLDDRCTEAR